MTARRQRPNIRDKSAVELRLIEGEGRKSPANARDLLEEPNDERWQRESTRN